MKTNLKQQFDDMQKRMFDKVNSREARIAREIRKKYSINDELAILRQRDSKPQEFEEYNNYVENCKAKIK